VHTGRVETVLFLAATFLLTTRLPLVAVVAVEAKGVEGPATRENPSGSSR
jgi:hypothetical protein